MIIAWDKVSDRAQVSVRNAAEVAGFPATNVQSPHLSKRWRGPDYADRVTLDFVMEQSAACSLLTLVGSNLSDLAEVRVLAGDYGNEPYLEVPAYVTLVNCARTPYSSVAHIYGDIDVRAKLSMADWAPGTNADVAGEWYPTNDNLRWTFRIASTGALQAYISLDGQTYETATSSVVTGFESWSPHWIRFTREAATGTVRFYTGDDGVTWTQLGTDQSTTAGEIGVKGDGSLATPLYTYVGYGAATFQVDAQIFYVEARDGVDGPLAWAFDPRYVISGSASFASPTSPFGETWTRVNGGVYRGWSLDTDNPATLTGKLSHIKGGQAHVRWDTPSSAWRWWSVEVYDPEVGTQTGGTPGVEPTIRMYIEVGRLLLWPHWEPDVPQSYNWSVGVEDLSVNAYSYGGQRFTDIRPRFRVLRFELGWLSETEAGGTVLPFLLDLGSHGDIFVVPDSLSSGYSYLRAVLGRMMVMDPVVNRSLGVYQQRFVIEERL